MGDADAESRYKSLIQPIKDLAANWDVDIADSLTDYLDELDGLRISVDDGQSNLNFAEAALLIQGSTIVYSKKVEYLHQLVLQSLEYLVAKRNGSEAATDAAVSRKSKNQSMDDEDILFFSNDPSFLLLDHVVEEGQNIDLKPSKSANLNGGDRESGQMSSFSNDVSRVSISLMHSVLSDDQGSAGLKLSTSLLDSNGALLIGGIRPSHPVEANNGAVTTLLSDAHNMQPTTTGSGTPNNNSCFLDNNAYDGDDFADDYDMGDGVYESNEAVCETPVKKATVAAKTFRSPVQPKRDMFALLDPHEVVSGSRPVRRGKTYKLPPTLSNKSTIKDSVEVDYLKYCVAHPIAGKPAHRMGLLSHLISLDGLYNPALMPVLEEKRKAERSKRLRMSTEAALSDIAPVSDVEAVWIDDYGADDDYDMGDYNDTGPVEAHEGSPLLINGDTENGRDYNLEGAVAENGDVWAISGETEEEELARRVEMVLNEEFRNDSIVGNYEIICRKYIENFHKGANLYAKETHLSKRVAEWTNRLEPILQRQEEEEQYDIHRYSEDVLINMDRTIARRTSIRASLNSSDLHVGGDVDTVSFEDVAAGKSAPEVCRVFLACLQLVNMGNLSVLVDSEENIQDTSVNVNEREAELMQLPEFKLRLNTHKKRIDIENFRAPSINTSQQNFRSCDAVTPDQSESMSNSIIADISDTRSRAAMKGPTVVSGQENDKSLFKTVKFAEQNIIHNLSSNVAADDWADDSEDEDESHENNSGANERQSTRRSRRAAVKKSITSTRTRTTRAHPSADMLI